MSHFLRVLQGRHRLQPLQDDRFEAPPPTRPDQQWSRVHCSVEMHRTSFLQSHPHRSCFGSTACREHESSARQTLAATCPASQLDWHCPKEAWVDGRDTALACPWLRQESKLGRQCGHSPRCLGFALGFHGLRWLIFSTVLGASRMTGRTTSGAGR